VAADLDKGLLLVEDLGDRLFGAAIAAGDSQAELWRTAVDALIALRGVPVPLRLPLSDGSSYTLPRRDRAAFEIEIELLLDWLWPAVKGAPAPASVRTEFGALWAPVLDRLLALPGGWFLRDYHSPNLIWLPARKGVARVGILDFQDALNESFAFDLVSLLQDARVDVPEALESELFSRYCTQVKTREPAFDRAGFTAAYADFGAQRNTRLLGLWARLLRRDGKPQYLQHFPRTWGYLTRNLRNPSLAPLAAWYERHFPPDVRSAKLLPGLQVGGWGGRWPASSSARWCCAPASARAWPIARCPSLSSLSTGRRSSITCSTGSAKPASSAPSSTSITRPI
jgi:aminoglycoside/choline kinase family phosphotransferase